MRLCFPAIGRTLFRSYSEWRPSQQTASSANPVTSDVLSTHNGNVCSWPAASDRNTRRVGGPLSILRRLFPVFDVGYRPKTWPLSCTKSDGERSEMPGAFFISVESYCCPGGNATAPWIPAFPSRVSLPHERRCRVTSARVAYMSSARCTSESSDRYLCRWPSHTGLPKVANQLGVPDGIQIPPRLPTSSTSGTSLYKVG
jgi:hypothetical protein